MDLYFSPVWPWWFLLGLAVALAGFAHWSIRRGAPFRRLLLFLRYLGILLALLPLLRPTAVFTKQHKQSSVLVLLVDKSKSMLLRDMWDDQSRWEAVKRLLDESEPALADLREDVQVRTLPFARRVGEAFSTEEPPDGEQTAVGAALSEVLARTAGERLAGIILLSDGSNNAGMAPTSAARQLASYKIPVHCFGFGRETASERVRDISARSIVASPTVFAKNKMTVRAEFASSGFASRNVPVRLLLNGVEKNHGHVLLREGADRSVVDLTAVPDVPGDVKVTIVADPQPGELLPGNNSVSTFVSVLAGGISVVEIEGKYRYWEPKFVRWALDQSPDIELSQLFLLDAAGKAEELPQGFFKPGRFDVVILGDVARDRFTDEQLRELANMVTQGTGLLWIGGYESFGPGGWGDSPLADLAPITMRPADAQATGPVKVVPTEAGLRHFIARLVPDPAANQALWQSLRPLDGGSTWGEPKAAALVLATSPEGRPILVAHEVGAGRIIAFAGDTTWRWRKDAASIAAHARFWRQLILWLAHKEESAGVNVRLRLGQRRLAIGQQLPVEAIVEDAQGAPVPNVEVQGVVITPDGKENPFPLIRQGSTWRSTFSRTDQEGDYRVKVVAMADGKPLGSRESKFLVYAEDTEMLQLAADLATLRNLSQLTGGEYHSPEELPKFLRSLKKRDLNLEVAQSIPESLWDTTPMYAAFLVVLTLEWVIRKRLGMP